MSLRRIVTRKNITTFIRFFVILLIYLALDGPVSGYLFESYVVPTVGLGKTVTICKVWTSVFFTFAFFFASVRIFSSVATSEITSRVILMQAAFGAGISIAILILWMMLDPEMYTRSHHIRTSAISPMLEPFIMFSAMAILEETLYRGILQRFLQSFLPIWIAAAIQIGIFVLGHDVGKIDNIYSFYRAADLCAAGILFTVLANRSKYLILPILAHFSENFFTGLFNGVQDLGLGESYLPIMDFDLYLHEEVRIVIILCVSVVLLIWMKKKYPDANDLFAKGQSSPAKNSEEHAAVAAPQVASI